MMNLRGGYKLLALPLLLTLSIGTLFVISNRSVLMPHHSAAGFDLEGPSSASQPRHLTPVLAETTKDTDSAGRLETPPGYTASTTGARRLFAHFGDGEIPSLKRFMVTTFVLINDSIYSASGRLNFYDDSGKALKVKIGNSTASSFPVSLKAGESKTFQTSETGELKVGWAAVETDQPITGRTSSFSMKSSSGTVYTEVGVPESMLNTEFTLFADSIGEVDTGVALVDSVSPSQLVLAVGDDVDDPDGQITIEILDDGTIRITYTLSGTSEVPAVQGMEIESVFRLDGITFTQQSMTNPPLVQATMTSVPSQPGGGETGLVADQGSTIF